MVEPAQGTWQCSARRSASHAGRGNHDQVRFRAVIFGGRQCRGQLPVLDERAPAGVGCGQPGVGRALGVADKPDRFHASLPFQFEVVTNLPASISCSPPVGAQESALSSPVGEAGEVGAADGSWHAALARIVPEECRWGVFRVSGFRDIPWREVGNPRIAGNIACRHVSPFKSSHHFTRNSVRIVPSAVS